MKKLLILIMICVIAASCNRSVCPAYMDGEATGVEGSNGKKSELFPKELRHK